MEKQDFPKPRHLHFGRKLFMPFHRIVVPTALLGLLLASNVFAPPPAKEEKAPPPWELARAKVDAARRTCLAIAQEYLEGRANGHNVG